MLHAFERWPTWMWANEEVVELAEWLRRHNDGRPAEQKVGFYGLDVYSLWDSLYAVMGYLQRSRSRARCRPPGGPSAASSPTARTCRSTPAPRAFVPNSCEDEVVALLQELRAKSSRVPRRRPRGALRRRAERPGAQERRGLLPDDGAAAAPSRGTSATAT